MLSDTDRPVGGPTDGATGGRRLLPRGSGGGRATGDTDVTTDGADTATGAAIGESAN